MSWFSKNYEKAALGGAAVLALGMAYFGWSKFGSVESDFAMGLKGPNPGQNQTAVTGAEKIPKALQSLKIDRTWTKETDGDRPVDLFTGIALFVSSSAPDKPVDLDKDSPVHEPIPNTWWLENRLDPGFADSPDRDPDTDGFSNREEFLGKTDPNDPKSHPEPLAKLVFEREEALTWVIRPGYGSEGKFPLTYREVEGKLWKDRNKISAANMIGPGEMFFEKPPMANRFKFLGSEQRKELNPRTNIEMDVTIVRIEDQRPNKKGDIYEIPSPLQEDRVNEYAQYDRTAILTLEALGQGGTEFKVEERTAFALPPSNPKKDYFLKSVSPNSAVVEYNAPDGSRKSVEIPKGGMPTLEE